MASIFLKRSQAIIMCLRAQEMPIYSQSSTELINVSWHPGVTKLANGCPELQISSSLEKTHLSQSCCPSRNQHPLHATPMPSCPECVVTAEHWCFRSQSSSSLTFRTQLKCHRPFLQLLRGHPFTFVVTGLYLHDSNIRVCF